MKKQAVKITEAQIQEQIMEGLRAHGYLVKVTSARSFRSENGKGYGADKGVPDLIVTRTAWPAHVWLGLEVKAPGVWKFSCLEQRELHDASRIAIVCDIDQAVTVAHAFEARLVR